MDWKSRPLTEMEDGYKSAVMGGVPVSLTGIALVLEKLKVPAQPPVANPSNIVVTNNVLIFRASAGLLRAANMIFLLIWNYSLSSCLVLPFRRFTHKFGCYGFLIGFAPGWLT